MPLIYLQVGIALLGVVTLGTGAWLLVHARDVARLFRTEPDIAVGPGRKQASKATTWAMLAVFNAGWIAAIVFWSLMI